MFGKGIAMDLGTSTVLIYIKGKGIVLQEPSVVAVDNTNNRVLAVGTAAQKMLGRTPGSISAIRPLRNGVISNFDATTVMIEYYLKRVCSFRLIRPSVIICIPSKITEVERRSVIDAARRAGARKVFLIEEPMAAAIGAGLNVSRPAGSMVVDIGGGTTDIAVLSYDGIVKSASIKTAGDAFDEAIIRYVRKCQNVLLGERTAEQLKIEIGCMVPRPEEISMEVKGRCLSSGLPRKITVTSTEMLEALEACGQEIVDAVHRVMEGTPPELLGDIGEQGITLTGGGSLVWGLDTLLADRLQVPAHRAEQAQSCVVIGTGMALDNIQLFTADPVSYYDERF